MAHLPTGGAPFLFREDTHLFGKELAYVRERDLMRAPAEYSAQGQYESIPTAYKKPRVEYRLDDTRSVATDAFMKQFFAGLDYCETAEKTVARVAEYLMSPMMPAAPAPTAAVAIALAPTKAES